MRKAHLATTLAALAAALATTAAAPPASPEAAADGAPRGGDRSCAHHRLLFCEDFSTLRPGAAGPA
jgi:Spy/CpxP family protein refolding chaperone